MIAFSSSQILESKVQLESDTSRNTKKFFLLRTVLFICSTSLFLISLILPHMGAKKGFVDFLGVLLLVPLILLFISLYKADIKKKKELKILFITAFCIFPFLVFSSLVPQFTVALSALYFITFLVLLIVFPQKYKNNAFYKKWLLFILFGFFTLFFLLAKVPEEEEKATLQTKDVFVGQFKTQRNTNVGSYKINDANAFTDYKTQRNTNVGSHEINDADSFIY